MAGVAQANVIDLVAQDASGTVLLVMVESRAWGETSGMPSELKEKINTYATFILDGGLVRQYPAARGLPVDIQLNCPSPPTGPYAAIVEHATAQLKSAGIGFRVSIQAPPST
jgi:hypothetical protein